MGLWWKNGLKYKDYSAFNEMPMLSASVENDTKPKLPIAQYDILQTFRPIHDY